MTYSITHKIKNPSKMINFYVFIVCFIEIIVMQHAGITAYKYTNS